MTTERDVTRIIRTWLSSEPPDSADRVLSLALDEIDTTQQRRATSWPVWSIPSMPGVVRLAAVAAAIALAAILITGYLARPNVGGPDDNPSTALPQSTLAPMPRGFAARTFVVSDGRAQDQVQLQVPTDGSLVVDQPFAWRLDLRSDAAIDESQWGIAIVDVTNATSHRTRFGRDQISSSDPASFLASLRDTGSYDVHGETVAEIDGRPALLTEITGISSTGDPCSSDGCWMPHLDVGGEGYTRDFAGPNRTYITTVGERLFLVEVWAAPGAELTPYLDIADRIVGSIRFAEAS